jgi:hypothetical protein
MRVRHLLPALLLVLLAAAPAPAGETGSILGRVFDGETLRPVRYAYVTVATAKGLELGTAGTDRDGRFRLDDVPAGFHRLVGWRGAEGSDPLPEIAVLPGEEVRHVELVLVPRAVVRLRVETPSGREPDLEWCVLEARADQPRDGPPPRRRLVKAVRRATGSLELRAEAGAWDLVVHAKGLRTHVLPLVLEEFERRFVTVELSPGVSVLGRVLDRDGEPVGGAVVQRLRLDAPRAEGATWTADATGRFDLAGAAAAPTRFRVKAFGFRERIVTLPLDRAGFIYRRGPDPRAAPRRRGRDRGTGRGRRREGRHRGARPPRGALDGDGYRRRLPLRGPAGRRAGPAPRRPRGGAARERSAGPARSLGAEARASTTSGAGRAAPLPGRPRTGPLARPRPGTRQPPGRDPRRDGGGGAVRPVGAGHGDRPDGGSGASDAGRSRVGGARGRDGHGRRPGVPRSAGPARSRAGS